MRFVGESSADADGVADFVAAANRGEADVVDLGIRAPDRAAGDGDFELARQIVKVVVGLEGVRDPDGER